MQMKVGCLAGQEMEDGVAMILSFSEAVEAGAEGRHPEAEFNNITDKKLGMTQFRSECFSSRLIRKALLT